MTVIVKAKKVLMNIHISVAVIWNLFSPVLSLKCPVGSVVV